MMKISWQVKWKNKEEETMHLITQIKYFGNNIAIDNGK